MMQSRGYYAVILIAVALFWSEIRPTAAHADGGILRAWKQQEGYDIAVFTEPSSLVLGPVDISVCLLDRTTGETVQEAQVMVEVWPLDRPTEAIRHPATEQTASNKLLRAAIFEIRDTGRYKISVRVDGPKIHTEIRFEADVGRPWTPESGIWPWILWPLPAVVIYLIHSRLVERRSRR